MSLTRRYFIIGLAHNCLFIALGGASSKTQRNWVPMEKAKLSTGLILIVSCKYFFRLECVPLGKQCDI